MQNPSADAERAPQQLLSQGKVSHLRGITHPRATDPFTIQLDSDRILDTEAELPPGLLQKGEITGAVTAKT